MNDADFTRLLELEEEYIQKICSEIILYKPDVVFTEKGVSDLAQHFLLKVRFFIFHYSYFYYCVISDKPPFRYDRSQYKIIY